MAQLPYEIQLGRRNGEKQIFIFRQCTPADLAQIVSAQEEVIASMENARIFARTSEEEIRESLEKDLCLGAFCQEKLALFSLMLVNRVSPRNLGSYLGYGEEELRRSVTYDTTFVMPEFRGFGLQALSCRIKDELALTLGAVRALATVAPENEYSLRNVKKHGFHVIEQRPMYSGLDRYIVEKTLIQEAPEKGERHGEGNLPGN